MPSATRGLATAPSDWSLAPPLPASVAASSEDHPDDLAKSLGSESGSILLVHFLLQAKVAINSAPFHRGLLAPHNEGPLSAPETLGHASVIDQHRVLSVSPRPSQRPLAEPRVYILLTHAKDHRNRLQTKLRRRLLELILALLQVSAALLWRRITQLFDRRFAITPYVELALRSTAALWKFRPVQHWDRFAKTPLAMLRLRHEQSHLTCRLA